MSLTGFSFETATNRTLNIAVRYRYHGHGKINEDNEELSVFKPVFSTGEDLPCVPLQLLQSSP